MDASPSASADYDLSQGQWRTVTVHHLSVFIYIVLRENKVPKRQEQEWEF